MDVRLQFTVCDKSAAWSTLAPEQALSDSHVENLGNWSERSSSQTQDVRGNLMKIVNLGFICIAHDPSWTRVLAVPDHPFF